MVQVGFFSQLTASSSTNINNWKIATLPIAVPGCKGANVLATSIESGSFIGFSGNNLESNNVATFLPYKLCLSSPWPASDADYVEIDITLRVVNIASISPKTIDYTVNSSIKRQIIE